MCDSDTEAVLAAPGVYSFAAALRDAEARGASPTSLAQLRIFCAGTCADYAAAGLPALSPAAAAKLQQLTIASLAARTRTLAFADMRAHLGLDDSEAATHALEDLIVDGLDAGLFRGRIDAAARTFDVHATEPRDVATPEARDAVRAGLAEWLTRAQHARALVDDEIQRLTEARAAAAAARADQHDMLVRALVDARPAADSAPHRSKRSRP